MPEFLSKKIPGSVLTVSDCLTSIGCGIAAGMLLLGTVAVVKKITESEGSGVFDGLGDGGERLLPTSGDH